MVCALTLGVPFLAHASSTLDLTGSFMPASSGVTVLVRAQNRTAARVSAVRIEGAWKRERARTFLQGGLAPGESSEVRFHFTQSPPPGTHALVLLIDFERDEGGGRATPVNEVTFLQLGFDAVPAPAVRIVAPPTSLRESAVAAIGLESADGQAHRVHLWVWPPHVLACDPPRQRVEVPPHGTVTAHVRLFRGLAAHDSGHELVVVAETEDEPLTRTTVASAAVWVGADSAWLPRLRPYLLVVALLFAAWAAGRQIRIRP
jgi:hypothetical protein